MHKPGAQACRTSSAMRYLRRLQWNDSSVLIHPPGFYIIGFTSLPFANLYFLFLAFVYVVSVVFNTILIYIITVDHRLHNPKFIAVGNLAVVDLVLNTCIIPGMLKTFLAKNNFVSFNLCMVQMYVYYCFMSMESFSIAVLAYDRMIAICFPLRHGSINTMTSMSCILGFIWCFCLGMHTFSTSIMTRLSYCDSVNVYSYFCDYAPVFRLACNDNTLQWAVASAMSLGIILGPLSFILMSYISILIAVFRMKTVESRVKALATCTEHLILVAVFFIPVLTIFMVGLLARNIKPDPDLRVLSLSLASCIPPCLNPIVYSLKTKEIKSKVLTMFRRIKVQVVKG
ncbi:olfactory receptor 1M1-like [Coregonus clupeaformis]|uniref:olfactory receptor 1M1-like n=1 Tax=Coregonus clupeaformis TaxID=59861 RepID=UPI001BDFF482|nr:olfactory receptor 1M1-like [Coregonus clupeaformis]